MLARQGRPGRRYRPEALSLEGRTLLNAAPIEPTADEQYMLQLINRARSDPKAEAARLLTLARTDPLIQTATQGWDVQSVASQIAARAPVPPLAFNTRLIEAARDESATMLTLNNQVHSPKGYLIDPNVAKADDGQAYYPVGNAAWAVGENIYAFTQNVKRPTTKDYVDYLNAGLMIDWYVPSLDHLKNLLEPGPSGSSPGQPPFSEIGIGLLTNAQPATPPPANPADPANKGLNVGPVLVSQEFAWHQVNAFLTGAVYQDADQDQFYTPGEGLGGVTIQAVGLEGEGTYQTTTWGSGGYSLALPPGRYVVAATENVPAAKSTTISIGSDNVGWDVRFSTTPAPATPTTNPSPVHMSAAQARAAHLAALKHARQSRLNAHVAALAAKKHVVAKHATPAKKH